MMKKRPDRTIKNASRIAGVICAAAVICALALLAFALNAPSKAPLSAEKISLVLESNEYPSPEMRAVTESAVSLVGKVHYFWGGKYDGLGPDPAWGEPRIVTSEGSVNTGKELPWGLDCSGFVTWAFIQAGYTSSEIGHGTWNQWFASDEISLLELRPGDLVFQNPYPGSSGNHVGICVGRLNGQPVAAHCSSAEDNVVVTYVSGIFNYARRPILRGAAE